MVRVRFFAAAASALVAALTAPVLAQEPCLPAVADDEPVFVMNQLGTKPARPVTAILRLENGEGVPVRVIDANDAVVASATSVVFGDNASSDEPVHRVRVNGVRAGEGYRFEACGLKSKPFDVRQDLYTDVAEQTLLYFYANRLGEPIDAEYVGGPQWARAAGFPNETVTCFAGEDQRGLLWPGCDYRLDVTGGWADAGDYGKYVVNGGIAVWTLQNAYERLKAIDASNLAGWTDGRIGLPENNNGVSEILDEARQQLDFMLEMQVPEGERLSVAKGPQQPENGEPLELTEIMAGGLVHHKVHEKEWLPLPLWPAEADAPRYVFPPSTAATLNMAAAAAQASRLWRDLDNEYANSTLDAAIRAYDAARRHPDIFAYDNFDGGGGYGDRSLDDEFTWTATELWITTGDERFRDDLLGAAKSLPESKSLSGELADIGWPNVAALGVISMIYGPSDLDTTAVEAVRDQIVRIAETYLQDRDTEGYAFPFGRNKYEWGSNGRLANIGIVLIAAYDVTNDTRYLAAAHDVMDYLFGRNATGTSFIAGFGHRAMKTPHHRSWAAGADPDFPPAFPGAVSGGPNDRSMVDPVAAEMRGSCVGQRCWVDDVRAYALNEVAINWNAPVFWLALALDTL